LGRDDIIVATLNANKEGLSRVPVAGGALQPLTDSKSDSGALMHLWPQALAGGKGILFAAVSASGQGSLRVLTPGDGKLRTLVKNSNYGRFLASGYLVYYQRETLFAAPMDADRLRFQRDSSCPALRPDKDDSTRRHRRGVLSILLTQRSMGRLLRRP